MQTAGLPRRRAATCPLAHRRPSTSLATAAEKLLSKQPELKADFSRAPQALSKAKLQGVTRFLPNPQANWGPKPKHRRGGGEMTKQNEQQQQQQHNSAGAGNGDT